MATDSGTLRSMPRPSKIHRNLNLRYLLRHQRHHRVSATLHTAALPVGAHKQCINLQHAASVRRGDVRNLHLLWKLLPNPKTPISNESKHIIISFAGRWPYCWSLQTPHKNPYRHPPDSVGVFSARPGWAACYRLWRQGWATSRPGRRHSIKLPRG